MPMVGSYRRYRPFYKGNLQITDRLKNMLVNSYGKNIYPTPVENTYLKSKR